MIFYILLAGTWFLLWLLSCWRWVQDFDELTLLGAVGLFLGAPIAAGSLLACLIATRIKNPVIWRKK